ncbi:MAG: DUF6602 domain-containing protein [Anaerolineae bacterium]
MLKSHMDAKENVLVAISRVPANAGHSLHKGTPREAFIREFLESHLSENVAIGTGEIIDASSLPNVQRNQFDIVIYKKSYPKLDFGGGISGFLVESVIATIEVKSTLTQAEFEPAVLAARASKALTPNVVTSFHTGFIPPKILNYVVAYAGPASMQTVLGWIHAIHAKLGIAIPQLPVDAKQRIKIPAPSIDGVFVLHKGFLYFDNLPFRIDTDRFRQGFPDMKWVFADEENGNLLLLFLFLLIATTNFEGRWLNPVPYLKNFSVSNLRLG